MSEEIQPCPFCGNKDIDTSPISGAAWCYDCHSVSNGVDRWNTRPLEDALKARIEVLEKQLRTIRLATVKAYTALKNDKPMTAKVALEICQLNDDIGRDAQSRGQ